MTGDERYAPPRAPVQDVDDGVAMWREGRVLVLRKGSAFPDRCVKCNAASVAPKRRYKLNWHTPWLYLLVPGLLVYVVMAALLNRRATVSVGLCARHQRRVWWGRVVGWGGVLVEVVLWNTVGQGDEGAFAAVLPILWLPVWAAATIWTRRIVRPVRIDKRHAWLDGCGPAFLGTLPDRTPR